MSPAKTGGEPPRAARWLLRRIAGAGDADGVDQALAELFRDRRERDGAAAAGRWYWRQVAGFGIRWRSFNPGGGGGGTMDGWKRDAKLAVRSLARAPGLSVVAVLALALGIGANAAIFSVIRGTLLQPLPYAHPERLVWLSDGHPSFGGAGINQSIPNLVDLRAGSRLMQSSAMYRVLGGNLATDGQAQRVRILYTSSDMLGVLGVAPRLGRDFLLADDQKDAEPTAILTDALWRSAFGGDPSVVGRTILVDARRVRVIGVLPPGFTFEDDPQLLMSLQYVGADMSRGSRSFNAVARLAPGADVAGLRAELQGIFSGLVKTYPRANKGWYTWAEPLREHIVKRQRPTLLLLAGAVALVLLIACVNVANLLLVRAETRHRELAVRYTLGARRSGLLSLFVSEGVVLSAAGGVLGLALAYGGVDALLKLYGGTLPRASQVHVDGMVITFGLVLTLFVGVLVGLVPLLRVRQQGLSEALKEGSRGSSARPSKLGRTLVAIETALAVVVVSGAALLANSMWHLQQVDLGVAGAGHVMTFTVSLPAASYPNGTAIGNFADALEARLGDIPGVHAVGLVNRLPLLGGDNMNVTVFGDSTREANFVSLRMITPGYFAAVGVPLRAGRWLNAAEFRTAANSVIINQRLARELFDGANPVGQRIDAFGGEGGLRVVGVCANIAGGRAGGPPPAGFYIPLATILRLFGDRPRPADDYWGVSALVRTRGDPQAMVPAFRAAVTAIDPGLPLTQVRTLQDIAVARLGSRRFATSLFGVFAGLALLLGAVGVYGVMSFSVTRRAPELGMRMALGASRGRVLRTVLGQGLRLTIPGVVVGIGAALLSARVLGNLLFKVSALDPLSYVTVVVVLTLVSLAAAWVPAQRATRVDPLTSIRSE